MDVPGSFPTGERFQLMREDVTHVESYLKGTIFRMCIMDVRMFGCSGTFSLSTTVERPLLMREAPDVAIYLGTDSRLASSQWETSLQSNDVSHWLGANLESALRLTG